MAARALTRSGDISPGYFTWLASDGWGKQSAVVNEIQEFAVGAITVELESKKIHGRPAARWAWSVSHSQSQTHSQRYVGRVGKDHINNCSMRSRSKIAIFALLWT